MMNKTLQHRGFQSGPLPDTAFSDQMRTGAFNVVWL